MVKKYLRENCDYTFDTLKENLPQGPHSDDSTLGAPYAQVDGCIPQRNGDPTSTAACLCIQFKAI
jgi:hypothetical protein